MTADLSKLSARQRTLLDTWLPGLRVEKDHSWGVVETVVLEVTCGGARFIVKAGGDRDHHIARELHAHRHWLRPWTAIGRASVLEHGDTAAKLVVTRYLPGELVLGSRRADEPATYEQAGELLALLHGQLAVPDDDAERRENDKVLGLLAGPHRIEPTVVARLRDEIASWPAPPVALVPTHGDWHPRNWLTYDGSVRIIDFGRAALRPAATDFTRLAAQDFRRDRRLEEAFLAGYGPDPREPGAWRRQRVREAVGTAVWARQVGDEEFEAQGHRMIADALAAERA